jgi:hypothetical protein
MRILLAVIAIAGAATAAAGAQPDKDGRDAKAPPPVVATSPVVLASASDVHEPPTSAADRSTQPVRRPAPRVTRCRCGDPQPAEPQPDQ